MCLSVKSKPTQPINPALGIEPTPHTSAATTAENATNPADETAASAPDDSVPASTTQAAVEPTKPEGPVAPAANDTVGEDYNIEHDDGQGTRITGTQKLGGTYSIQFYIRDANGAICNGMYYTIKVVGTKELIKGKTGKEGRTERVFSDTANDIAYLYIGHRAEEFDALPTSREGEENIYDEAILNSASANDQTMAPVAENKLRRIDTERLWKPWDNLADEHTKLWVRNSEGLRLNAYDRDSNTTRNVTIGVGQLIHSGPFVATQATVDQIVAHLRRQEISVTINNIVENVGAATGLTGNNLTHVQQEMAYVNGMTREEVLENYNRKFNEHRSLIPRDLNIPLHKREYEALCDIAYNRGPGTIYNKNDNKNGNDRRYGTYLNAGRYYYTGNELVPNNARSSVPNRRDDEKRVWFEGVPASLPNGEILNYQPGNRTPWNHVQLDN